MGILKATEKDGSVWVSYDDYLSLKKQAADYAAITEHYQTLLSVMTNSSGSAKISEMKQRIAEYEARDAQFLKTYGVTLDSYLANLPTSEDADAMAERE